MDKVNAYVNMLKFHGFDLKILSGNKILRITKGQDCVLDLGKWTHNKPNIYLNNSNEYAQFDLILLIHSQDIEWK